ncbi:heat shock 70 kDa protein 15-like protein [Tanacetum coccineum]
MKATHASKGLNFISKEKTSWATLEKHFDELTKETSGLLRRALFGECTGKHLSVYSAFCFDTSDNQFYEAEAPKKKVKKSNIPISEDRVMEETKDKKNVVEAYVYDMRNKLHDKQFEFVTDSDREQLIAKLQEREDWLYEDGEDETKGCTSDIDKQLQQGDPIEQLYKEHSERGFFVRQLAERVSWFRQAAGGDPKYDHIDLSEKQKVLKECSEAKNWLTETRHLQDGLPKHAEPVLLSADIRKRAEAIDGVCRPILSKPKPAPPKPATPQKQHPAENGTSPSPNPQAGHDENVDEPEAMETEKPEAVLHKAEDFIFVLFSSVDCWLCFDGGQVFAESLCVQDILQVDLGQEPNSK